MKWDNLPTELIKLILHFRKSFVESKIASYIQASWKKYKTKILIGRFKLLKNIKQFKEWNPDINTFILRSKL
jgi:hypothetical protein